MNPYWLTTAGGDLLEIPQSMISGFGLRLSVFGGGYLRLAPMAGVEWGVRRLAEEGRPVIVYVHPREIDPGQPRLKLPVWRRFKSYVNLRGTLGKLQRLCRICRFVRMEELAPYGASAPFGPGLLFGGRNL